MQTSTHLVTGVLIQSFIIIIYPQINFFQIITIILMAWLSHFVIDALAIMTYHPAERQHTEFWLYWHIFVFSSIPFVIIGFFLVNSYFIIGMLAANIPDIQDWIILRGILKYNNRKYYQHRMANFLRKPLIGHVPDFTYSRIGILPELILITGLLIFSFLKLLSYFLI